MKSAILLAFGVLALAVVVYLTGVPFNLSLYSFWLAWVVVPTGLMGLLMVLLHLDSDFQPVGVVGIFSALAPVAGVIALLVLFLSSVQLFHVNAYKTQIANHSLASASLSKALLPSLNINDAPLVSVDMAYKIANKLIARDGEIGSSFGISQLRKQIINGHLAWVGYLDFDGPFVWLKYNGAPGYVVISATDPNDAKLVTSLGGKPLSMKYLNGSWFNDNAERHLWLRGSLTAIIGSPLPQLDPTGRPCLVAPIMKKTIGLAAGEEVIGAFVLDTQTGQIARYNLANLPKWVSRLQPEDLVATQINNAGDLINGWFNPSNSGRFTSDKTPELVYGDNGRLYWYQGITSVGGDDGVIGYYMVDARTKQVTHYQIAGVTMEAVQSAAEGKIPQYHYSATEPLPFNVNGVPTYIMAMRDATGIARAYAMVDIHNYQTLAVDDTLDGALSDYATALVSSGESLTGKTATAGTATNQRILTGTLLRSALLVHHGDTGVVWLVQPSDKVQAVAVVGDVTTLGNVVVLAHPGDQVKITYRQSLGSQTAILVKAEDSSLSSSVAASPVRATSNH